MPDTPFYFGWRDLVDVAVVTLLFWGTIVWLRRTRAVLAFLGLAILAGVNLAARQLQLNLTAWIFQGFAAGLLVLVVVVFQDDLRRLLEQIGGWGLRRRAAPPLSGSHDMLVRAAARLAQTRTGALLVLPGTEPLERHLDGGVALEGQLSEPLLLSLFDPHSPGHDGAVLVAGDRLAKFALHLPLSSDHGQLGEAGTRHAAALGLAECSDALVVVVSEERGTVSVAHEGRLRRLGSPQELTGVLREFSDRTVPAPSPRRGLLRLAARQWSTLLLSLGLATGMWFLLGPGSTPVEVTRSARVLVENLPPGYELESVTPEEVAVTLAGPRPRLYLLGPDAVRVRLDALIAQLGRRTFQIAEHQVERPPETTVVGVSPPAVRLSLRQVAGAGGKP